MCIRDSRYGVVAAIAEDDRPTGVAPGRAAAGGVGLAQRALIPEDSEIDLPRQPSRGLFHLVDVREGEWLQSAGGDVHQDGPVVLRFCGLAAGRCIEMQLVGVGGSRVRAFDFGVVRADGQSVERKRFVAATAGGRGLEHVVLVVQLQLQIASVCFELYAEAVTGSALGGGGERCV